MQRESSSSARTSRRAARTPRANSPNAGPREQSPSNPQLGSISGCRCAVRVRRADRGGWRYVTVRRASAPAAWDRRAGIASLSQMADVRFGRRRSFQAKPCGCCWSRSCPLSNHHHRSVWSQGRHGPGRQKQPVLLAASSWPGGLQATVGQWWPGRGGMPPSLAHQVIGTAQISAIDISIAVHWGRLIRSSISSSRSGIGSATDRSGKAGNSGAAPSKQSSESFRPSLQFSAANAWALVRDDRQ